MRKSRAIFCIFSYVCLLGLALAGLFGFQNRYESVVRLFKSTENSAGSYDLADYAHCSRDVTATLNKLIAENSSVILPPGCFLVSKAIILRNKTVLRGSGRNLTLIQLSHNSKTNVLETEETVDRSAAGRSTDGWEVTDLSIDGGGVLQDASGTAIDNINGISIYGAGWRLSNVLIRNVMGHGIRSKWSAFGEMPGGLEASVENVTIDTVGRHGWWNEGPHDLVSNKLIIIDPAQERDNIFCALFSNGTATGKYTHFHSWHRAAARNRVRYSVSSPGGHTFTASDFEGGRSWFEHRGSYDNVTGSSFYGLFSENGAAGVVFLGQRNIHIGNFYSGDSKRNTVWAMQLGDVNKAASSNIVSGDLFVGFSQGVFKIGNSGGLNQLGGSGYDNASLNIGDAGKSKSGDVYRYFDEKTIYLDNK
ncbi:glycosyl hydrolase family 28-related protein [Methylobacterium brachiatum]|uniref:Glycosyl hydrolase family 28-related protein n=1 Tax=Methylobacterium brachiatum TaxID=269660 RepID=A0ABV1R6T9_9HYPH